MDRRPVQNLGAPLGSIPEQYDFITGAAKPMVAGVKLSLDQKLDEALPGDPHSWSLAARERLTERVIGLLVDDMRSMFDSHQQRDSKGCIAFSDEEDRQDFLALLGWVCGFPGQGPSHVPFAWAMRYFGFGPRAIREIRDSVKEAYSKELQSLRESFSGELTLH